ncbi:hypothetical protein [Streptomyces sp. NPDC026659]|uniref:hypothetical protein n=1 Tax=Streptomyces sp. NPDC026659 TaxID=3155123 RepID=UPI0033C17BD3
MRRRVEHPDPDSLSAGPLLDAWNFSDDLSHSLKADPPLPPQGAGDGAWTDEEIAAVREFLRAGLNLWELAVTSSVAS